MRGSSHAPAFAHCSGIMCPVCARHRITRIWTSDAGMTDAARTKQLSWRLSGFYATYFLAVGIYMPYWPIWLDGRTLDPVQIGWVLAASFWIKIAAQPAIARIADWQGRTRQLTTALMALAAVGFLAQSAANGFWPLLILGGLTAACYQPVLPIMESVTLRHVENQVLDYGRIRLWGSVAFVAATTMAGLAVDRQGTGLVVWLMFAAMALAALACAMAPERPPNVTVKGSQPLLRQFLSPPFLVFLTTTGLISASHAVLYGFGTLNWRAQGHNESTIGLFWAVGVLAEVALFALARSYRDKISPPLLLALAALGGVVRWPLLAVVEDAAILLALQSLHGFTFGAGHLGAMAFLGKTIPAEHSATGQSLYYALVGGILAGAMFPLAGLLYARIGGNAYLVMGVISGGALVSAVILTKFIPRPHP